MIDFIDVWWTVFFNVMILSWPMIYDSSFTSEYEKYVVNFDKIDFLDVWMNNCDFFKHDTFFWNNDLWFPIYIWIWKIHREFWSDSLHWRLMNSFFLNVMILSGPMIYDSPFTSEYEKYIENFELIDFIDVWWTFFYCDDFVWTNNLWFPIYIWIWKIHQEFWNHRLHWRLMNSFFFNLMVLSGPMIYDSRFTSEYEKYIGNFEMIDFIEIWWTVFFFFNMMIFSGPMIYDCPFTSEYEKYLGNFEMIDFIDVWWTVFFRMWWFCLDQWFMIPHLHLNMKNTSKILN